MENEQIYTAQPKVEKWGKAKKQTKRKKANSDEKWDMEGKTGHKAEDEATEIWHDFAIICIIVQSTILFN